LKKITLTCPWGDPLKESSGSSTRTKELFRLLLTMKDEFNTIIEVVGIANCHNGASDQVECIPGKFGLLLDFNPWYFIRRVQKKEDILIMTGPLGIFGALVGKHLAKKRFKIVYAAHNVERERMKSGALYKNIPIKGYYSHYNDSVRVLCCQIF